MITFKYKKEKSPQGRIVLRPIADVILENNGRLVEASMYIDSGADISLLPLSVGLVLGFSERAEEIKQIKGIAGESIPYIIKNVSIKFSDYEFKARIGWALIEEIPLLLGRLDIFPKFKITFDEFEKSVVFIPKR